MCRSVKGENSSKSVVYRCDMAKADIDVLNTEEKKEFQNKDP